MGITISFILALSPDILPIHHLAQYTARVVTPISANHSMLEIISQCCSWGLLGHLCFLSPWQGLSQGEEGLGMAHPLEAQNFLSKEVTDLDYKKISPVGKYFL